MAAALARRPLEIHAQKRIELRRPIREHRRIV
jgi:hypothetical protein